MKGIPKKVYKYREWTNPYHKKILTENQIYLASPKDFNDPFDCRIPKNYLFLDTDEKINDYIEKIVEKFNNHYNIPKEIIEKKKGEIFERLKNNIIEEQQEHEKRHYKNQDNHYGVFSLSARWESILMWGHYSENHKGFCIGFYEEELRKSARFGKGGMVKYTNEFPLIDPHINDYMEFSFIQTHTKAKDWKYEKEYRLQKLFYPNPAKKEDRIAKLPDSCYSEILLGLNFPEENIQEIFDMLKSKKIPIFKVEKVPFKFKLKRKRIE